MQTKTVRSLIGENAVTSSIRIAQVFPELVGKKTHALWKVYGGMLKYIINCAFYLARYDAYFHINDDAKKCRYVSVTNNLIYCLIIYLNWFHMKQYKKYALPWIHLSKLFVSL